MENVQPATTAIDAPSDAQLDAMFDALLSTQTSEERSTFNTDSETRATASTNVQDITATLAAVSGEPSHTTFPRAIEEDLSELVDAATEHYHPLLRVCFASPEVAALYADKTGQYASDSGWDLRFTDDVTVKPGETVKCDFGLSVSAYDDETGLDPSALWMMPRSSIVKTPLRMANSLGLIDSSYRGTLKAYVDNIKTDPYHIKKGDRLFQLVAPSAKPFRVQIVTSLDTTARGVQGFGSTGQ